MYYTQIRFVTGSRQVNHSTAHKLYHCGTYSDVHEYKKERPHSIEVSLESFYLCKTQVFSFRARRQGNEPRSVLLVRGGEMTPNQDPGISCMRPARQIIDLGRASRSELSAANNATKKRLLFLEVSFEYIIHNAQEKLFVARHQANEARSVLLVREH